MSKMLEEKIRKIMKGETLTEDKSDLGSGKEVSTSNAAAAQAKEEAAKNNKAAEDGGQEDGKSIVKGKTGNNFKASGVKEETIPGLGAELKGDTTTGTSGTEKTAKIQKDQGNKLDSDGKTVSNKVKSDPQDDNGDTAKIKAKQAGTSEKGGKLSSPAHEAFTELFDGESLTEDFITKAEAIFEVALSEKVAQLEEEYQQSLTEAVEVVKGELVEQIDGYLDYVIEQWMEDNAVALESGMKVELVNSFIDGIKNVFQEHYVDVPEDKVDVVQEQANEIDGLKEVIATLTEEKEQAVSEATILKCESVIADAAKGLTAIQSEKFSSLVEDITFDTEEEFTVKVKTIRESMFKDSNSQEVTQPKAAKSDINESSGVNAVVAALQKGNLKFVRN